MSSWFEANIEHGWASCPLTQNGYLRIVSQARYPHPRPLAEAYEQLSAATSTQHHLFIPDDVSLLDDTLVRFRHLSGPRQLTDVYLLALAVVHDAQLVTLGHSHSPQRRPTGPREATWLHSNIRHPRQPYAQGTAGAQNRPFVHRP